MRLPFGPRALLLPALLGALLFQGGAQAQEALVPRTGSAQASISDDNLDAARKRAVWLARVAVIRKMLAELVAPEWVALYRSDLRKRVLNRLDRYIGSYRVQRSETSLDRTRYFVSLQALVNRPQLVQDLRELSLPLVDDAPRRVFFLYPAADPLLQYQALREEVLQQLSERLTLLNLTLVASKAVAADRAALLGNPAAAAPDRRQALKEYGAETALFLATQPARSEDDPRVTSEIKALYFQTRSGAVLASLLQRVRGAAPTPHMAADVRRERLRRMLAPLLKKMQPRSFRSVAGTRGDGEQFKLRVLGFSSIDDEESFERAFFRRNTPFEKFTLHRIAPDTVTYIGVYTGDRRGLENRLRGKQVARLKIVNVFWHNGVLELAVSRDKELPRQEMKQFPPARRPPDIAKLINTLFSKQPALAHLDPSYAEVEDNGWLDRANPIPLDRAGYGFVDSRGDADFYVGEELQGGAEFEVAWFRLGRTSLSPVLRIYNEARRLVRTLLPRKEATFTYRVPKGEHRFFLEVSDRFGYLQWESGGYRSFHYLFRVSRKQPKLARP